MDKQQKVERQLAKAIEWMRNHRSEEKSITKLADMASWRFNVNYVDLLAKIRSFDY